MDCQKIGSLIYQLRKEKNMTQKELADQLHISDRTISKWERGLGCPDVSLLNELSDIFHIHIETILSGHIDDHYVQGGNMKRIKFYVCPQCGNVMTALRNVNISCCDRKLEALEVHQKDDHHHFDEEDIDGETYISFDHQMTKEHYISFVAQVDYEQVLLVKLYPEQAASLRLPKSRRGQLYCYCYQDGLILLK